MIRPANERGRAEFGWLTSRHSFSFGHYFDPRHMGFGPLRVINEDVVAPGRGFDTHGHRDMEIISYVLSGALEHRDSLGNGSVIRAGDVQRMTAGTGVQHSEYNHSRTEAVHFLQIWILPERGGLTPSYEQRSVSEAQKRDRLCLVASRDGRGGSVMIHRDVDLYATVLRPGTRLEHGLGAGRKAWIQVARGAVQLGGGERLGPGDGAALEGQPSVSMLGARGSDAEVLLFDIG